MNHVKIVNWMTRIDDELFEEMKSILLGKYITLSFVNNKDVTKEYMCEIISDHIEKIMLKNSKSFDELVKYYSDSLSDLVKEYLEKECIGKDKKGKPIYSDSRAIKYFNNAINRKNDKEYPFIGLEDYSRIILCLYREIINNGHQKITDFDYSFNNVKCEMIINFLESEESKDIKLFKYKLEKLNKRFKTTDKFSLDSFIAIMVIMMFYHLKNKEVRSDYQ